jgi:hypothetical protein
MDAVYIHSTQKTGKKIRVSMCDKLLVSVNIIIQRNRKCRDVEGRMQNIEK